MMQTAVIFDRSLCFMWYCSVHCVYFIYLPQVVHITPHGGVAPPMPSHSQSGQQQQQTPQQPTSSGHQTPTPSQHTPYAVQQVGPGVGVMPSAAGTPPQTHLYHAMAQHPVITPQGPAPPSPQVVQYISVANLYFVRFVPIVCD